MSAQITREQQALLAALAAGAGWPGALAVAVSSSRDPRRRARWEAVAVDPDPFAAVQRWRLLPPFLVPFVSGEGAARRVGAEAARTALRPWRGHSELTSGAGYLLWGGAIGIVVHVVLGTFVMPAFDMFEPSTTHRVVALPFFLVAGVLGLMAMATRMSTQVRSLQPERSGWVAVASLLISGPPRQWNEEVAALRWLHAAERAALPAHEVFRGLAEVSPGGRLPRFFQAIREVTAPRDALVRWSQEGLLSAPIARAAEGLLFDGGPRDPLGRLARLARHLPATRALTQERLLIMAGTTLLAVGALDLAYTVYRTVSRLGGLS